jgi:hypothetical protein
MSEDDLNIIERKTMPLGSCLRVNIGGLKAIDGIITE